MAAWKYIKGSEKDFIGAPEWCNYVVTGEEFKNNWFLQSFVPGAQRHQRTDSESGLIFSFLDADVSKYTIIAQRERVTSIEDEMLAADLERFKRKVDERFQKPDNVNHPKHYTQGGIECIDAIKAATVGKTGIEAVCVANVVKYLWRYEEKNGVEDVKKARWYLERLISELESDE